MYKITATPPRNKVDCVCRFVDLASIPFDPANTDYQQFKADIQSGSELQDPEGNTLTQQEAEEFIKTLP